MARIPGIVLPGYPHHLTQRGNPRQAVFFNPKEVLIKSSFRTKRSGDPDNSAQRVERPKGGPQGEHSE
jgi:REP element-mobilizing transposase RayT